MSFVGLSCARSTSRRDDTFIWVMHGADQCDDGIVDPTISDESVVAVCDVVQRIETIILYEFHFFRWPTTFPSGRAHRVHSSSETMLECTCVSEIIVHAYDVL